MTLIVNEAIVDDGLLQNAERNYIRNASYYLRIGAIIPAVDDGEGYERLDRYRLEPGAIAWIVSKEIFSLGNAPPEYSVTALVTLRSSFTKKGLLALDVGLVDPHFEGPIGSIVINFSKNEILLSEGEEFFRVIFFKHDRIAQDNSLEKESINHDDYITAQLERLVSGFPQTFLQAGEIEERIKTGIMKDEVIKGLEETLIDKLAGRLLRKHIGKIIGAAVLFGAGLLLLIKLLIPEYTDEEIKNIAIEGVKGLLPKSD